MRTAIVSSLFAAALAAVFAAAAEAGAATTAAAAPRAAMAERPTGGRFNFGRIAKPEEIAAWDIDVRPDGHGVRPGRGSVERGQQVYDAQCASCHGTFGESNSYLALAGGVRPEDLKTGRASRLRDAEVLRTLGTKLNAATTLFDYIYRAMPWTNPMSLSVDDTYAVTAYVLHLNDIVAADFELSDANIVGLPMPNRNGMTRAHGMGSVRGKPDVQGRLCMADCVAQVRITSELPDYARDAHGELAQQFRPIGPKGAVQTMIAKAPVKPAAAAISVASAAAPADLLNRNACLACHHPSNRVVGPSFREVGARHASRSDAEAYIARKIREGGSGSWGAIPMPAQPALQEAEAQALARWILGGAIQ